MNRRAGLIIGILGLSQFLYPAHPQAVFGQEAEAKKLFQEALSLKAAGNAEKAAITFHDAVARDRSVLSENDNGLIENLRSFYAKKLAANADDPEAVEGMGFVAANCDGDFPTALTHYSKALSLTTDEAAKNRISKIVDGLKVQTGAAPAPATTTSSGSGTSTGASAGTRTAGEHPDVAAAKSEAEAAKAEAEAKREADIANLTQSKEDLEAKIPRLESEIKALEEENERNHRMYLSTGDRRYKRKEDAGETSIEGKKKEMDRARVEADAIEKKIDRLTSREPEKPKPEDGQ